MAILLVSRSAWAESHTGIASACVSIGWGCLGVGVIGRIWCAVYIMGRKTFSLVTEGPYSMCRHPLYFFTFVGGSGAMLLTERLSLLVLFSVFFWSSFQVIVRREEHSLEGLHGPRFEKYRASVPAFWPPPQRLREPESIELSPRLFRQFLLEVVAL